MVDSSPANWNAASILSHLKQVAQEQLSMTPGQIEAIRPEARIVDGLELDSLAQVVLMTSIERDFGCTFSPEELQGVETVNDLVQLILRNAKVSQA
jgi:acyl carrier protein